MRKLLAISFLLATGNAFADFDTYLESTLLGTCNGNVQSFSYISDDYEVGGIIGFLSPVPLINNGFKKVETVSDSKETKIYLRRTINGDGNSDVGYIELESATGSTKNIYRNLGLSTKTKFFNSSISEHEKKELAYDQYTTKYANKLERYYNEPYYVLINHTDYRLRLEQYTVDIPFPDGKDPSFIFYSGFEIDGNKLKILTEKQKKMRDGRYFGDTKGLEAKTIYNSCTFSSEAINEFLKRVEQHEYIFEPM